MKYLATAMALLLPLLLPVINAIPGERDYTTEVVIEDTILLGRDRNFDITVDAVNSVEIVWRSPELDQKGIGLIYSASKGWNYEMITQNVFSKVYDWGDGEYTFEWETTNHEDYEGCTLTYWLKFTQYIDSDGDGRNDISDDFPDDPSASADTDEDGSPDRWNDGYSATDSTQDLHLDKFPYNEEASIDDDNDGYPTFWNRGYNGKDSSLRLDMFPTDPSAAIDTDWDGSPDCWCTMKNGSVSTLGLHLDAFPLDPSASVDQDGDGYPDKWNSDNVSSDSTTGLILDAYPDDPGRWFKEDKSGIPLVIIIVGVFAGLILFLGIVAVVVFLALRKKEELADIEKPREDPFLKKEEISDQEQKDFQNYGSEADQYKSLYG